MRNVGYNEFEKILAFHSSPAMLGVKPASLFSVTDTESVGESISRFNRKAAVKGLKIRELCCLKNRRLLLMYNEKVLERHMNNEKVLRMFGKFGYDEDMTTQQRIDRLAEKIVGRGDFPHEIGLFLGYPVEDIQGFIDNKGENYLLCGYWKVYSDEERAKRIFNSYNKCRSYMIGKLNSGVDIYKALRIS